MQTWMCTASDVASCDGTAAEKPVRIAAFAMLSFIVAIAASGVSVGLVAGLAVPAIVSLAGVVGLIRIRDGCGPPL